MDTLVTEPALGISRAGGRRRIGEPAGEHFALADRRTPIAVDTVSIITALIFVDDAIATVLVHSPYSGCPSQHRDQRDCGNEKATYVSNAHARTVPTLGDGEVTVCATVA